MHAAGTLSAGLLLYRAGVGGVEVMLVHMGGPFWRRGKLVHAFAIEADLDVSEIVSNTFALEWPRGSGRTQEFRRWTERRGSTCPPRARSSSTAKRPFWRR
ncbi:MAG TPA: hypothetical protein VMF09_03870 [Solirubrobacteraceae bacterium]|nr:hypothetical protein [Solirubrobacteraceae bacterium]